jgi:stringent starvation protein A
VANIFSRRSVMTLFSPPTCPMSHAARFVLFEKAIVSEIEYYDPNNPTEELLELNPTGVSPTLVERDLVLYDSRIIMEYLDERFPHPPLHQMDPVSRASARMIIKRIDQDWYPLLDEIQDSGDKKSGKAKKQLRESLLAANPIFTDRPFFMSEEFSLIDCALAPLLWRLPSVGIDISTPNNAISNYAQRMFSRPAFKSSLSEAERELAELPK